MRSKINIISIVLYLLIFSILSFSKEQKGQWKGKIDYENGVKVVKNPAEAVHGEFVFQLEEDLSLGNENDDNYYFPKGASIALDDQENLYVLDSGNTRIQKYDAAGKYVQTIGRKGQGPGEFQFPSMICFDGEGNLCVYDMRSLKIFAADGTYKKSISLVTFIQPRFYISRENFIFGMDINYMAPEGPRIAIVKLNPDGSTPKTIAQFQGELKPNQRWYALHSYSNFLALCGLSPEAFCFGFSAEYKIYLADAQGDTILMIVKDEKPKPISREEKNSIIKSGMKIGVGRGEPGKMEDMAVFPRHRPCFDRIITDDAGRIYVMKKPSILDQDKTQEFDVFSREGIYLYKVKLPFMPEIIKAGSIYEIQKNEETGDIKIIRHKVKNWDQIKEGI